MSDIIVVGYPKSGNTWLTRLVAELIGCPVSGFLGSEHDEIAREGLDRISDFRVIKAHHQYKELIEVAEPGSKIIYVVRDPRDVCLSGSTYFKFHRFPSLVKYGNAHPMVGSFYRRIIYPLVSTRKYRMKRMTAAVLYGLGEVQWWLRVSWKDHYKPYMDRQCFFVRYEDVIEQPRKECARILTFIGVNRNEYQIENAIRQQSFETKKMHFIEAGDHRKARFLKVGNKDQWNTMMSQEEKKLFDEVLGENLSELHYSRSF